MIETSSCLVCAQPGHHAYTAAPTGKPATAHYDYHQCASCGLLYQHPMPDDAEIASFYPDSYSPHAEPTRTEFSFREIITLRNQYGYTHLPLEGKQKPLDKLRGSKPVDTVTPWVPNGRVLDVGCGNGEYLLRQKSIGWQCFGVDFNPNSVQLCRSRDLDVRQGALLDAEYENDFFDLITAHHFIEHVPNPIDVMAEMTRILKPGGRLLLRTPNNAALGRRWFGDHWYANDVPAHVTLFSERSLELLASSQGLQLEKRYRPIKHKFILKSLNNRLGKPGGKPGKLAKWLAKLYIPAARLVRQGDELFDIYVKPAT